MTEVTAAAALWPLDTPVTPGAAGLLLPGVRARIVHPTTGSDLGPGEAGELWLRSPAAMVGYRHDAAATAATVDSDGWLHTGDIARIDADGAVFVVDRVKELIKVKRFRSHQRLEDRAAATRPVATDAAVIGVPDKGSASVQGVRRAGGRCAGRRGRDRLLPRRAGGRAQAGPRGRVRRHDPDSPAGKTLRRMLRDRGGVR